MRKFTTLITTTAVITGSWMGCSGKNATELVPGVSTQMQIPRDLKTVRVDLAPAGEQSRCIVENVNQFNNGLDLPRTLGVLNEVDRSRIITITIWGYDVAESEAESLTDCLKPASSDPLHKPRILRRARVSYVNGKILFLPMPLRYSCYDVTCKEDETCKAGDCVSADVDSATLPEFNASLIDGKDNLCFSPKNCAGSLIPAKTLSANDCTYTFSVDAPAGLTGMNVKVFYDGGEAEILDLDKEEGFEVVDTKTVKLAPGLCKIAKGQVPGKTINTIMLSPACAPKTMYQPLCKEELLKLPNLPDGGFTTDGICNVAKELQPAPSLLYIMMDDAQSMAPVFGPKGLKQVLSFNLTDPAFRTTYVAFRRFDHKVSNCVDPSNALATPEIGFELAPTNQAAIAAILGNESAPLASNPPLYIDSALRGNGAYQAIKDFTKVTAFNRRAVMLIANRRFGPATQTVGKESSEGGTCNLGAALVGTDAADNAFKTDKINTYSVMLANKLGGTPVIDEATAIAKAGGTDVIDARSDDQTVAVKAFNKVVADLGSCLYETPSGLVPDSATKISYLNPISVAETSIPFSSECTEAKQSEKNGWNTDGNRIRICGQPCATLRDVITTVANAIAAKNLLESKSDAPPSLPLYATKACASN